MQHRKVELSDEYSLKVIDSTDQLINVFDLVHESFEHGPYGGEPDDNGLLQMIQTLRDCDIRDGVLVLLYHNDFPVGYIAANISTHPFFANDKTAVELGWYVRQRHRKYSIKLLEAFEEWAKIIGCKRVAVAHYMHNEDVQRISTIYKRKKYKPIETAYVKELI